MCDFCGWCECRTELIKEYFDISKHWNHSHLITFCQWVTYLIEHETSGPFVSVHATTKNTKRKDNSGECLVMSSAINHTASVCHVHELWRMRQRQWYADRMTLADRRQRTEQYIDDNTCTPHSSYHWIAIPCELIQNSKPCETIIINSNWNS